MYVMIIYKSDVIYIFESILALVMARHITASNSDEECRFIKKLKI